MIAPSSTNDLLDLVRKSGIVRAELFDTHLREYPDLPTDAVQSAATLVKSGLLTRFQAKLLLTGRYRGFKLGPYVVKEQIGQGGMGAVYLAEHETLRRLVALKVLTLSKKDANSKLTIDRFQREARAAAALDHPNIVRMHDVGKHADIHYLAMEYVEGQTLEQILTSGGPITPSRAVEYIAQAAAGLQHAYEKGFIHRDIKPANLMLAKDGTIKILDMGLARSFTDDSDKLTEVLDKGAVVGTADFISPEQAMNAPNIDIRSDIYNLGATLFTLITGKSPFSGNTTQKLLQHQLKDAPSLMTFDRTLPNGLAEVVGKMLQKKPERRYQTPAEVISALANWLPEHGAGRVMVGLSSTDLGSSGKLQNTLNEIAASGTRRLSGTRIGNDKKKPWALWGGAAALVLAAIGVVLYAVLPTSTPNTSGTSVVANSPPVTPTNPNKAITKSNPIPTSKTPPKSVSPVTVPIRVLAQKPLFRFDAVAVPKFEITWKEMLANQPSLGLPKGIALECWKPDADAAYRGEILNGVAGLSVSNLTHASSAQLSFDIERGCECPLADGKEYRFRVAYRTTPSTTGYFDVKDSQHKTLKRQALADTAGRWSAEEFTWTRPDGVPIRIVVGSDNVGAENAVSIGALEIFDPNDLVLPKPMERILLAPDFSQYPLFSERGKLVVDEANPKNRKWTVVSKTGTPPPKWTARTWSTMSEVEWAVEKIENESAIGFRSASGVGSMMLFTPPFEAPSRKCRLSFTYRTEENNPNISLKFSPLVIDQVKDWNIAKLAATDGKWVTMTLDVDLKGTKSGFFEFHNVNAKGLWAWVRNLTVTEAVAPPESPKSTEQILLAPDFTKYPLYRERGKLVVDEADPKNRKWTVVSKTGSQPPQWSGGTFRHMSEGEWSVEKIDDEPVIGFRTASGEGSMMLFAPQFDATSGKCLLTITYRTETGNENVLLRFKPQRPGNAMAWDVAKLPATDGQWATKTFDVDLKGSKGGFFEFHNINMKGLWAWIKNLTVAEVAEDPKPTSADGSIVYTADFGTMKPAKFNFADSNFTGDSRPNLPTGIGADCWKSASIAEFSAEEIDGKVGFGITNLNDEISAQIHVRDLGNLIPSRTYRVRLENLTQNDAVGRVSVRKPGGSYTPINEIDLTSTGGKWKMATFDFVAPAGIKLDMQISSQTVGEGNRLTVHKVEILEAK